MKNTLLKFYRMLGPLGGGILLDTLDLATFGPFGIYFGWFIGLIVGWWMASIYQFGTVGKFVFASLAAIYLTLPMTEFVPIATLVSAISRFRGAPPDPA
jgi:hypothetical protein